MNNNYSFNGDSAPKPLHSSPHGEDQAPKPDYLSSPKSSTSKATDKIGRDLLHEEKKGGEEPSEKKLKEIKEINSQESLEVIENSKIFLLQTITDLWNSVCLSGVTASMNTLPRIISSCIPTYYILSGLPTNMLTADWLNQSSNETITAIPKQVRIEALAKMSNSEKQTIRDEKYPTLFSDISKEELLNFDARLINQLPLQALNCFPAVSLEELNNLFKEDQEVLTFEDPFFINQALGSQVKGEDQLIKDAKRHLIYINGKELKANESGLANREIVASLLDSDKKTTWHKVLQQGIISRVIFPIYEKFSPLHQSEYTAQEVNVNSYSRYYCNSQEKKSLKENAPSYAKAILVHPITSYINVATTGKPKGSGHLHAVSLLSINKLNETEPTQFIYIDLHVEGEMDENSAERSPVAKVAYTKIKPDKLEAFLKKRAHLKSFITET